MYWDTHMHSSFSGDSDSTPESMADEAAALGLPGICFTDHLDIDYPDEPDLFLLNVREYLPYIHRLSRHYDGQLDILCGVELGLQLHLAPAHRHLLEEYDFDFVIGSSHVVHGKDPYYAAYFDGRSQDEAFLEYFTSILENIHAFHDFDVYGHLDYVVRYGPDKNNCCCYEKYRDLIDEILRQLILSGKGLELNTAGFKYGLKHPNPCEEILKRYHMLGGEIITLGSDAHQPGHIAYAFDLVRDLLMSCGFSYYSVFRSRKPEFIKL